ncbi:MAG: alkaline phosphatase D family protein [Actinobacteria bacterium]|nr:alkaline phosphatase D family protein [Actinomycetota bacterium]
MSAGAAAALAAPRPAARADASLAPFLHGVASGDPASDRVILWTRVTVDGDAPVEVTWEVATDLTFTDLVRSGIATATAARDFTVKIDADGLASGRWYYYRFTALGKRSLTGRTRTAPDGAVDGARFGVVSCANYQHGFFNAYALLAERGDLDAIIHCGDYLYEYQLVAEGGYGEDEANLAAPRRHEPPSEMIALADYRTRHAQYKLDPDLRRLHQLYPWITTWDDHESTNNSYRDGAENHDPETEGDWEVRKDTSRRVYDEWMPTRVERPDRLWRSLTWGDLLEVLVLDTRLERDEIIGSIGVTVLSDEIDDPDRIMIGEAQRDFLYSRLSETDAAWKVIAQQTIMAPWNALSFPSVPGAPDAPVPVLRDDGNAANPDQWDGYTAERDRLFTHIRDNGVEDIVVLTGDVHSFWAIDLTDRPFDPTSYNPVTGEGAIGVEFVTSSVTSSGPVPDGVPPDSVLAIEGGTRADNPHVRDTNFRRRGYVVLDVTPERAHADWWLLETVQEPSLAQEFGGAWQALRGDNHLSPATGPLDDTATAPPAPDATPDPAPTGPDPGSPPPPPAPSPLPTTGAGLAALGLGIAAAGAVRLRDRRPPER